jgi:hypothetical protein
MKTVLAGVLLSLLCASAGCASAKPGRVTSRTSAPSPVDPVADNEKLLADLVPGLVITLEIIGSEPKLKNAHVAMVPRQETRREEGELIRVVGLAQGQEITSVAFPDERVNIEEHGGIVVMDERTVATTLPLPRRIDVVEVRLPRDVGRARFSVHDQIDKYCRQYPGSELCR